MIPDITVDCFLVTRLGYVFLENKEHLCVITAWPVVSGMDDGSVLNK